MQDTLTRIKEMQIYKKKIKGYADDIATDAVEVVQLKRCAHYFAGILGALHEAEMQLRRDLIRKKQ